MPHPRLNPYQTGRAHGLDGLPRYSHRNYRRYDSANANDSYERGYGYGIRQRTLGANTSYDLFELHGVATPTVRKNDRR